MPQQVSAKSKLAWNGSELPQVASGGRKVASTPFSKQTKIAWSGMELPQLASGETKVASTLFLKYLTIGSGQKNEKNIVVIRINKDFTTID